MYGSLLHVLECVLPPLASLVVLLLAAYGAHCLPACGRWLWARYWTHPRKVRLACEVSSCRSGRAALKAEGGGPLARRRVGVGEHMKLLKAQQGCCAHPDCWQPLGDVVQRDHIRPLYAGGLDAAENEQLLHPDCHQRKTVSDLLLWKPASI